MNRIPNWLDTTFIAHRGFFNESAPENSLESFNRAIKRNFAVELDVQVLKDDTLVVFHDDSLLRLTGYNKLIKDVTYEEIKHLKLLETDESIPTFREVLKLIEGRIPLMIEFKNESKSNRLEELSYKLLKEYEGEYIIQSFNPLSVKWFKKNAKEVIRGQLSCRYENTNISNFTKFLLRNVLFNIVTKPDFVIYDIKSLDHLIIKYLKFVKKPLYGYTAKSVESYKYAKSKGVTSCFEGFDPNELE